MTLGHQNELESARSERRRVLGALNEWLDEGRRGAVVTVVHAWGSTYRRPGALMAVDEDGQWIGTISGGCLEGDVSHVARRVLEHGRPLVVRYDLEEDDIWGLGIGCGGGVDVLVEPLDTAAPMVRAGSDGGSGRDAGPGGDVEPHVVATLLSGEDGREPDGYGLGGALELDQLPRIRVDESGTEGDLGDAALTGNVVEEARRRLADRSARSGTVSVRVAEDDPREWRVFFHVVRPDPVLLVLGGGHDAIPLVRFASEVGFRVIVSDPRPAYARPERFPGAEQVLVGEPGETPSKVTLSEADYVIIMNHHKARDTEALAAWKDEKPGYIGMLGPRTRTREILEELGVDDLGGRLFAPIGLDIGGEGPEGVALSIVAELVAHRANRRGGHLRDRQGSIHAR